MTVTDAAVYLLPLPLLLLLLLLPLLMLLSETRRSIDRDVLRTIRK